MPIHCDLDHVIYCISSHSLVQLITEITLTQSDDVKHEELVQPLSRSQAI